MPLEIFMIFVTHWLVPVVFMLWLYRGVEPSQLDWVAKTLLIVTFMTFIFLGGGWSFAGYFVRFIFMACLFFALLGSIKSMRGLPRYPQGVIHWLKPGINLGCFFFWWSQSSLS